MNDAIARASPTALHLLVVALTADQTEDDIPKSWPYKLEIDSHGHIGTGFNKQRLAVQTSTQAQVNFVTTPKV